MESLGINFWSFPCRRAILSPTHRLLVPSLASYSAEIHTVLLAKYLQHKVKASQGDS